MNTSIASLCAAASSSTLPIAPLEPVFANVSSGVSAFPAGYRLDSVASLVQEFAARPYSEILMPSLRGQCSVPIYETSLEDCLKDQARLLNIVKAHNCQFQSSIQMVAQAEDVYLGVCEEAYFSVGTKVYVCADLHGQIAPLIEVLTLLKNEHLLNEHYVCARGFCMVFLGDYIDRGANDFQLLSLLLRLRMENPTSVFLLRGNHEDVDEEIHAACNNLFIAQFFRAHREDWKSCFQSFPLALWVSSREAYEKSPGQFQHQYVHFSHGLFSLSVDPVSVLTGQDTIWAVSRLDWLSRFWDSTDKVRAVARDILCREFRHQPSANNPLGYLWSDIGSEMDSCSCRSPRGIGFVFSVQTIHLVRKASETALAKICFFVRGHQHECKEHVVARTVGSSKGADKVIAMTLPMYLVSQPGNTVVHGMLCTIESRVRDWKKSLCVLERDPHSHAVPKAEIKPFERSMYKKF